LASTYCAIKTCSVDCTAINR